MVGLDYLELSLKTIGVILLCVLITIILTLILKKLHVNKHIIRIPLWLLLFVFLFGIIEIPLGEIYRNRNALCKDPEVLNKLQNDATTAEFVLDGEYYSLPCSLRKFMNDGWISVTNGKGENVFIDNLFLDHDGYALFSLPTSYGTLSIVVDLTCVKDYGIGNARVIGAFYTSDTHRKDLDKLPNLNFFVTKNGVTETTSFQQAREQTKGFNQECIRVAKRNQTEPMSPDVYGNCYDLMTSQIPDEIYTSLEHRYYKGFIQESDLLPGDRRFFLEKQEYSMKRALSYSETRGLMLAAFMVIPGTIVGPFILFLVRHKRQTTEGFLVEPTSKDYR